MTVNSRGYHGDWQFTLVSPTATRTHLPIHLEPHDSVGPQGGPPYGFSLIGRNRARRGSSLNVNVHDGLRSSGRRRKRHAGCKLL